MSRHSPARCKIRPRQAAEGRVDHELHVHKDEFSRAVSASSSAHTLAQALHSALAQYQAGRFGEAEALCRQVLAALPENADAAHLLGLIAAKAGRYDAAADWIQKAAKSAPTDAMAHYNLGKTLLSAARPREAAASLRRVLELRPDFAEAYNDLGIALGSAGQMVEAIGIFRKCLELAPDHADAWSNLGKACLEISRPEETTAACRECLRRNPRHLNAWVILGNALEGRGAIDEASAAFCEALRLDPHHAEAHLDLGNCFKDQGLVDEAISSYRDAVRERPDWAAAHSSLLLALHYHTGWNPRAILEEHRLWQQRHAEPLKRFIRPWDNKPDPERPLRIGYVSGDFREHPVARFFVPLLEHHDGRQFAAYCYSSASQTDGFTAHLRGLAAGWRNIAGVRDDAAAELIRKDRIDILVDLSAHTAGNRLLVFAQKPAPVQATYLAYCSTTGLDAIDFRITDRYLDPPERSAECYTEKPAYIPDAYWCYLEPKFAPAVQALPARAVGAVTFGCLNSPAKMSAIALDLWRRILQRTPGSRLLLYAHVGSHRQRIAEFFSAGGVNADRVEFVGKLPMVDYLALYGRIDVALDPFPFCGGTTSCDALWMGVPFVSLAGDTAVSRAGVSLLSNVGLPELVADCPDEYVDKAAVLAGDLSRLAEIRAKLRSRMRQSPLMDAKRFARGMESVYREMWREWCARRAQSAEEGT